MKRVLLISLICVGCFIATKSGQAQNASQRGPIRLEESRPSSGPLGPVYTLRFLKVSDAKPTEHVWLLQKMTTPSEGAIEPSETVFRSLKSPVLLNFISHLPLGTRIAHLPTTLPSRAPKTMVGSDEPGLLDFVQLCRSMKIDFVFGVVF